MAVPDDCPCKTTEANGNGALVVASTTLPKMTQRPGAVWALATNGINKEQTIKKRAQSVPITTQRFKVSSKKPTILRNVRGGAAYPKSKSNARRNLSSAGFFSTIMSYRSLSDRNAFFSSMACSFMSRCNSKDAF